MHVVPRDGQLLIMQWYGSGLVSRNKKKTLRYDRTGTRSVKGVGYHSVSLVELFEEKERLFYATTHWYSMQELSPIYSRR
jgi:hypothetical protein